MREAIGEDARQPGSTNLILRFVHVVGHAVEGNEVLVGIVNRLAGAWISVAWLPYRSRIDQVHPIRIKHQRLLGLVNLCFSDRLDAVPGWRQPLRARIRLR
jgi:hypothetical protein